MSVTVCKPLRFITNWCFLLLIACASTVLAQSTDCTFSPSLLPLLYGKADFQQLKQEAWDALQCAPRSSETHISALSTLATIYRTYRNADSLKHYQNQALALSSEHLPPAHPITLRCKLRMGLSAVNNADFSTSLAVLDELDSLFSSASDQDQLLALDILRFRAIYHREQEQLEEASSYYQQGLQLCETLNSPIGEERKSTFYGLMSAVVEAQGDPLGALKMNQRSLDIFFQYHDDTHPEAVAVYSNLGMDYWRTGFYQKAISYLNNSYRSLEKDGRADEVPTDIILNNMGGAYYQLGDIDKAIGCYQKAGAIRRQAYGPEHPRTMVSTFMLGSMYAERNQPKKTIELLEYSRQILEQGSNSLYTAICNNNLAIAYRNVGEFQQAEECYEAALKIYLDKYSSRYVTIANTQRNLGFLYTRAAEYDKAKRYLQQALDNYLLALGPDSGEVLYLQGAIAEADYLSGEYEKARTRFADVLAQAGLPANRETLTQIEDKESTLKLLQSAVNFHWAAYEESGSEQELHELIRLAENGIELLQIQRNTAAAESSKVFLTHRYYGLYEQIIQAELALARADEDRKAKAFALNAQAKAGVLYDAIQLSGAKSFAGVPADSLQSLRALKIQLSFVEKQIAENSVDSIRQADLQKQVFNIKRSLENTEQSLQQIPAYAKITQTPEQLSAAEVSAMLPAGSVMINYFLGDHSLAIFVTPAGGPTASYTRELPENFEDNFTAFLENVQRPEAGPKQVSNYQKQAEALYDLLLADALKDIPNDTQYLIIVPDGMLAYLPFGVLLEPSDQAHQHFADLPYLLKTYEISYAPSPIIWQSMSEAPVPTKGTLVFAPSFQNETPEASASLASRKAALGPLFFNLEEGRQISELTGSKFFTESAANLANFKQHLGEADILHFATHAKVEENLPRSSYLAFNSTDSIPEHLFLSEIYNLNLQANMVVLSACETGLGRLQRGEGLISLARGFAYAGAKSIVPSLWAVNDQATASIMTDFYQGLVAGQTKSTALRQAQLQYLSEQKEDRLAHPYYWAAFTIIGDNAPVEFGSNHSRLWLIVTGLGLGFLIFLFARRLMARA